MKLFDAARDGSLDTLLRVMRKHGVLLLVEGDVTIQLNPEAFIEPPSAAVFGNGRDKDEDAQNEGPISPEEQRRLQRLADEEDLYAD